jgi:outer membrane receptor protein involved in Fe transport
MHQVLRGIFVLAAAAAAFAQTAQITGRVMDPSDAIVPAATVTITSTDTGVSRTIPTNDSGYYTVPLLPRGNYRVSAAKAGFRTVSRTEISLDDGQVLRLDFSLPVGQVAETIEVTATASLLDTSTTSMATVVPKQRIEDLPLLGRNPVALAALVPGVRTMGGFGGLQVGAFDGSRMAIGGGAPSANNFMIDGVASENFTSGGTNVSLSVDATEEFRIITRNPSAEYGRTGGGVINTISRSGTNQFHGSAFEFLRNETFDANAFYSNRAGRQKAPFSFNQYGATLGGPVRKSSTFFFFNWEAVRQSSEPTALRTVPTELQKRGDFTRTVTQGDALIQIYDPATTIVNPASPSQRIRTPFPGNVIPQSRINPVARATLAYYPAPNTAGVANTGVNSFFGQAPSTLNKNIYGIKVDHNFTPGRRTSARFTYDSTFSGGANYYGNVAESDLSPLTYQRRSIVLNHVETINPTLLIEARAGLNRYAPIRPTRSYGFDVTSLGLPASLAQQMQIPVFPRFDIADVSSLGTTGDDHLIQANNSWTAGASATKIHGSHTIKTGAELRVYQLNNTQGTTVLTFTFSRGYTQGPNPNTPSVNAGYGFASFLLGDPSVGFARRWTPSTYTAKNVAAYVQDDWKVTSRLTLNLGVRWDYEGPITDRFNGLSNFDPNHEFKLGSLPVRGALVFPGSGGLARGMRDASLTDFEPRFGFAYKLLPSTSVRGGFGIYHLPGTGLFTIAARTGYDYASSMVVSVDGGFTPYNTLSNPFPEGIQPPPGNSQGPLTGLGTTVTGNLRSMVRGYSEQWNFNVQQAFAKNWLIELGYSGNHGVSLPASRNFTYLPERARDLGTQLQTLVPNPYYGQIAVGTLAQQNVTRATLLNYYPQFTASGLDSWAGSIYHALTARVEKRFSRGFSMLLSYTFSKLIDDNVGNGLNSNFTAGGSNGVQNWDNLRVERAISTSDLPHNLVLTSTWTIPAGRPRNKLVRKVVTGWSLNPMLSMASGNPIAVTAPSPAFGGSRPNVVGDPTLENPTINRWLNPAAFVQIQPFTFGNAPRNLPRTRTDGPFNLDLSLLKSVSFHDRYRLQFRGEFFNFTNTPTFGQPASTFGANDFGIVSSASSPRRIQLGIKVTF